VRAETGEGGKLLRSTLTVAALAVLAALALGVGSRFSTPMLMAAGGRSPVAPSPGVVQRAAATASPNALRFRADGSGHFYLEAEANGTPVRFLVDTGASLVALTLEDARAAGLDPATLSYSAVMSTANGTARAAPVRLRSLRLGQLELEDVNAVVMERPMAVSLLGMSFLERLQGYSIRNGVLTVEW
jgi:aspartyl protease family protein